MLCLQHSQWCFVNHWTSELSIFRLCLFVQVYNVRICQQVFLHWASAMIWWIANNLMTKDTSDSMAAYHINSAMELEMPEMFISRIVSINWILWVHIYRSLPRFKYDLQSNVTQGMDVEMFIFGSYHNLPESGIYRLWLWHRDRNLIALYLDWRDCIKLSYSNVDSWILNIDSSPTSEKKFNSVRHCVYIAWAEYQDISKRPIVQNSI